MDIMMPPLHEQPAPAPWLIHRERIDVPGVICSAIAQNPDATPDEVNQELWKRHAEVPGPLVVERMKKCKVPTA